MLAQLIPSLSGPPVTLHKPIFVVGRSEKLCDLVIDHTSISKVHCILVKTDGLIYMRDLCSTNGTRVNGQRVIRGALLPGDRISFASITYKVHLGPDLPVNSISNYGATEAIPIQPDAPGLDEGFGGMEQSRSDVRKLRDSEFLPPD
ncbi:MAG: FHA domain-containing protein [Planctomycetaceae bacterium]|nr:FHA domain-containing protein [Planctomycetaceae bacterium]